MKIELSKSNGITFGDVKAGDVFVSYGGSVCMKIELISKPGRHVNAVYLDDGSLAFYEDSDLVIRIIKNAVLREEE